MPHEPDKVCVLFVRDEICCSLWSAVAETLRLTLVFCEDVKIHFFYRILIGTIVDEARRGKN